MYVPKHFAKQDVDAALALIGREPFATLVSVRDGEPFVTHAPLLAERVDETLVLTGHLARVNPHAALLDGARILAIFHGPHGYISPRWYAERALDVPTWNYTTVHCSGVATVSGEALKAEAIHRLVHAMEGEAAGAWSVDELAPAARDAMLKNIVAFSIRVEAITAKFKLGQNRTDDDREGAIAGLRALADAMESELTEIKHA